MIVVGGNVYRKKYVGCLSFFYYFNLLMLSVAQLYWRNSVRGQKISAEISVGVAFMLLLGVLVYHASNTLLKIPCISQSKTSIVQRISKLAKNHLLTSHEEENIIAMQTMPSQVGPTFTEVGLSDCREAGTDNYMEEHDTFENTPPYLQLNGRRQTAYVNPYYFKKNEHNIIHANTTCMLILMSLLQIC